MSDWKSRSKPVGGHKYSGMKPGAGWKDRAVSVGASPTLQSYDIQDETAAPVGLADRTVAKALSADPAATVKFLQQKYPGMEVQADPFEGNNFLMRKPGESQWSRIDPNALELEDVSDLAYDVPAAAIQGASTTLGAGAGALTSPVTGPVGPMAGASAASAASGAGLEWLRQKLGQAAGIPQEINTETVKTAGKIGAAAPILLGSGKLPAFSRDAVAQYAAQKGIAPAAAEQLLTRGVPGIARDFTKREIMPRAASLASGLKLSDIRAYSKHMDKVDDLVDTGVTPFLQSTSEKVTRYVDEGKAAAANDINQSLAQAGVKVNVAPAKQQFVDRIKQLSAKPDLTKADQAEIRALQTAFDRYFGLAQPKSVLNKTPEMIAEEEQVAKALADLAGRSYSSPTAGMVDALESQKVPMTAPTYEPAHDAFLKDVNKYANTGVDDAINVLKSSGDEMIAAQKAADEAKAAELVQRMTKLNTPDEILHIDDMQNADRAFDLQKRLKQLMKPEQNMTPANAAMKGSAGGAYRALNKSMEEATAAGSQRGKDAYRRFIELDSELSPKFEDAQKTYNTLTGLDSRSRRVLQERLKNLSNTGELDIMPEAEIAQAFYAFKDPASAEGRKAPLASLLGSVGSLLGYKTGGGAGGVVGGAGGMAIGAGAGSRTMTEKLMKLNRAQERLLERSGIPDAYQYVSPYLGSAWTRERADEPKK